MFIIYAIIMGIIIGYIRGGRLKWIISKPIRRKWLVFFALFIQLIIFSNFPYIKLIPSYTIAVFHIISYICLIIFLVANIRIPGIIIIGIGSLLNSLIIFLNGGFMPSLLVNYTGNISQGSINNNIVQISKETIFPWLGDIFHLPMWLPLTNSFSLGDIFIAIGVCIYFTLSMRPST